MTTFPHSDSELTFAAIDSHVRAQSAAGSSAAGSSATGSSATAQAATTQSTTAGQTQGNAWQRLIVRYTAIRPILAALSAIPLIPPTWRASLAAFIATADEASLLVGTVVSTLPTPDPVTQPDFKAGKDQ